MLLTILLVFHIIVCILLIITVLMQQSEGGALGMGGGPSGFMSARGAGNVLTRATWILFGLFLVLSIGLTILGGHERASSRLVGAPAASSSKPTPLPSAPLPSAPPLGGSAQPAPGAIPGLPGVPTSTPAQ